ISIESTGPAPGAVLSAGTLTITGTSSGDFVGISVDDSGKMAVDTPGGIFQVDPASVSIVRINVFGGDDSISISGREDIRSYEFPTTIDGGDGNDGVGLYFASGIEFIGGNGNDGLGCDVGSSGFLDGGEGNDSVANYGGGA